MKFRNSVLRVSVNTRDWLEKTAIRCLKTASEVFIAMTTGAVIMSDVNWGYVGSATLLATIICFVSCIPGIPEVTSKE